MCFIVYTLLASLISAFLLYVRHLRKEIERWKLIRAAERKGRIKAESALRDMSRCVTTTDGENGMEQFMRIGTVETCFHQRNGTPRQSLLIPNARAKISFLSAIPQAAIEDLKGFSHLWMIYVFHQNTNLHNRLNGKKFKAKVQVPRLDGRKISVFATRSPHRYNNIGLSVVQITKIEQRCIHISGVDVLDGTPILDIKPYIPLYDAVPSSQYPEWLKREELKKGESLYVSEVRLPAYVLAELQKIWPRTENKDMGGFEDMCALIKATLKRDLRSLSQRKTTDRGEALDTEYRLMIAGISVWYTIDAERCVEVRRVKELE